MLRHIFCSNHSSFDEIGEGRAEERCNALLEIPFVAVIRARNGESSRAKATKSCGDRAAVGHLIGLEPAVIDERPNKAVAEDGCDGHFPALPALAMPAHARGDARGRRAM